MAWVNAVIPDFTTGTITGDITNISTVVNPQSKQARANEYYTNFSYAVSFNQINYVNITVGSREFIYGDSNLGLSITRSSGGFIQLQYTYYSDGIMSGWRTLCQWDRSAIMNYSSEVHTTSLFFTINDETHHGTIIAYSIDFITGYASRVDHIISYAVELTDTELAYNIIQSQIPILYTWQSVPSISGKNGILSLVTLDSEAINDGEPVSGAAISVFDQAPSTDNNVKDLADTYGSGEESSAVDVTVKYKVTLPPGGAFSVLKLVAKKDSIPEDATDGDKIVDISPTKTKKTVTGLDENSMYYFKIFAEDSNSNTSESDEKHILTSGDEGYNFDYTGEIVEWTVPKTGIYSLETWGAQGGDATDGTNSARGGYGAYAYGEVLLTQGEKLYINVGGQNGYGGGGNANIELPFENLIKTSDLNHYKKASGWSALDNLHEWYGTDWNLFGEMENCDNASLTKSNEEYYLNAGISGGAGQGGVSRYAFTLNSTYRISKIEFDAKFTNGYNENNHCIQVEMRKSDSDSLDLQGYCVIVHNTNKGDRDYNVTDENYHTYSKEFVTPIECDYLVLYQAYYPAYFKNIKLTIVS